MPMFVTFYSYKGGVGRTLALANVATLLARDRGEPCRVLVWDFDLPAPGLQDVVKCKWTERKIGFVDYLDSYLRNAEIDDITKYIHETTIPNVDILPAGFMGQEYAQRLEEIQWQEIYEQARGFQFIAETKSQISKIEPAYDYVLIDSLTGYSDVGGICVNQLADAVVLIFRLNQQNIEGISKVYHSIGDHAMHKSMEMASQLESVVPVISPAWPFAASESNEWFQKAQKVFGSHKIFTLSFEGSMMLGEKILCAADEKYAIEPPILRDYRILTTHLRSLNPQDLKTTYKIAQKSQEQNQFLSAIELFGNLVEHRPNVERYWRELTMSVQVAPAAAHKQILPKVHAIIRRGCEAQKAWAYVARAWLAETVDGDLSVALENFGKAIELEPQNANLYFFRGLSLISHELPADAANDFSKVLDLKLGGPRLPYVYFELGRCYRLLGQFIKAIECLRNAIKGQPSDSAFLFELAATLYAVGSYSESAVEIEKAIRIDSSGEGLKIFSAHVAASMGKGDEAQRILEDVRPQAELEPAMLLSLAEAYLVVSPRETLSILEANPEIVKDHEVVAYFLKAFSAIRLGLTGVLEEYASVLKRAQTNPQKDGWFITELLEFLKWGRDQGQLTAVQHSELLDLIEASGWPRPGSAAT